jgi:hypothetical protein
LMKKAVFLSWFTHKLYAGCGKLISFFELSGLKEKGS